MGWLWWCAVAAAAEFVEEEEASTDVDIGRVTGHTAPYTPQTVNPKMMMLEARVSICGKVADTARRLMVQRSRTIRRTLLNWGAVGEVVESGLLAGLLGWEEFPWHLECYHHFPHPSGHQALFICYSCARHTLTYARHTRSYAGDSLLIRYS